ncbi:hypothetical protein SISNIDRAFT_417637, partial [Sistotremastrum niveocremeum HHB9708]
MALETSTSGMFKIQVLTGPNWAAWKRRMSAVLSELDLFKYIDGSAPLPGILVPTTPTPAENLAIAAWHAGDRKARTRIELSISDEQSLHTVRDDTAKAMWDTLRTIHEPHGVLGVL